MYLCYTDGACKVSEHTPGGWGVYIKPPKGEPIEKFGGVLDTNSTHMELTAVKVALEFLPNEAKATIFTDSEEVIAYCGKSLIIWRENGFKNLPLLFELILKEINSLLIDKNLIIIWTKIKSHNGNAGNERADHLANLGARDAKKLIPKT